MPKAKLFLIDAHALCYRSFYAIKSLTNSKGQATNAVYGFVNTLKKIIEDHQPEYMAVCFDSPEKTFRQEKFTAYKIQRPSMPDDLISQIPIIKAVIKAFRFSSFEVPGYEADDIIATLAENDNLKDLEVTIVSEDKDLYQLANGHVKFFSTRKDQIWDKDELQESLGFDPRLIVDFIGLAGDKVDNIPGVKGVGEVTAIKLVKEFGRLEDIYKNLEKIDKDKVKEKLIEQKDEAFLSKELAVLERHVPLNIALDKMKIVPPDNPKLFALFKELEFRRLAAQYAGTDSPQEKVSVETIDDKMEMDKLIKTIQSKKKVSLYIDPTNDRTAYLSVGNEIYATSLERLAAIKEILVDQEIVKIVCDAKNFFKFSDQHFGVIPENVFDVMLAGFLLNPALAAFQVNDLYWAFLKNNVSLEEGPAKLALAQSQLYDYMAEELKAKSLDKLYTDIELPLAGVLYTMESAGVKIDEALLKQLSTVCAEKIADLTGRLYEAAGGEFNLNSPKQLSQVLFEKLKLPSLKKTKTGFSTDEGVLTVLAKQHDVPALILEYRQYAKLKSTYIDALPQLIDAKTGRIHAIFDQVGAETGRLSSRNPNLQNIPIRTELGQQIRKAIVSSGKDYQLISADYSQIELRILAHLSKDENLLKAFNAGEDIHDFTASLIFEVKEKDVTPSMRTMAKRVNFGIIYGMSAFGLAKDLGISNDEAEDFIAKYFLRYPKVKKFMDEQIKVCETQGYVLTLMNRRRYIPDINSKNNSVRMFAQRQAINTPVQGSAADLIKCAMIDIDREIKQKNLRSKMIITVHDELVFDSLKSEHKQMVDLIRRAMEKTMELAVPIKVSVKVGPNWLQMTEA